MNLGINESISEKAAKHDAELLKLIKQRKKVTTAEIAQLIGKSKSASENAARRMLNRRQIHLVKERGVNVWYYGSSQTTTTYKNRFEREYKPFSGVVWQPEINRPGCQDFLKCPSRVGNSFIPHRPMMHGCTPTGVTK